ncbi:phosphoribosyltransferase domain-containing protein [Desulfococcus sp.]|uniref:phosphoribosyltransferase domain-containing protein n=1 Tax=Desulfococcus sp. TaxID=2025834 RepID=UPI003594864D
MAMRINFKTKKRVDPGSSPDSLPAVRPIYHLRRRNNARRRSAMTFSCLGKVAGTSTATLSFWKSGLKKVFQTACRVRPLTRAPLIIGLAESGIIPSALFHQIVRESCPAAGWICSTRRPSSGIRFSEGHSHAPDHSLPDPETRPTELWFVEDEITTGQTLLALSLDLCRRLDQRRVRYVTFANAQTPEMKRQFRSILSENGIAFSVHTLFPNPPADLTAVRENFRLTTDPAPRARSKGSAPAIDSDWHFPDRRPALRRQMHSDMRLPAGLDGSLLAVGEAVDLGMRMIQINPKLQLHHITLSPWEIDDVNIQNRLDIGDDYYLYNLHNLRPPLYILNDPMDDAVAMAAQTHLNAIGFQTRRLDLA